MTREMLWARYDVLHNRSHGEQHSQRVRRTSVYMGLNAKSERSKKRGKEEEEVVAAAAAEAES